MASFVALDDDADSWQRVAIPVLDLEATPDLLESVSGIVFQNGGVTAAERTVWFDRVEAIENDDEAFMEEVQRATFEFFWQEANPSNGLIRDRLRAGAASSIAAVGFGLSAYTVGVDRGWITRDQAVERVGNTLRFFWNAPSSIRAMSKSRSWPTATAMRSISANATARCNGGTRS